MSAIRSIFGFGFVAFVFLVMQPFPLLLAGPVLGTSAVGGLLVSRALLSSPKGERVTPAHIVIALFPWLLAALVLANGAFDRSAETRYHTVAVRTESLVPFNIVVVKSWQPGRATESLYLKTSLFHYDPLVWFHAGEPVTVGIRPGALGVPWISSISQ